MAKQNATFLGTSNALIPIGENHAYAFSGVVEVTTANEKILSFSTGKKYLVCNLQVTNGSGSNDDVLYTLFMNGVLVIQWFFIQAGVSGLDASGLDLLVPPNTTVVIHGDNQSSATGRAQTAWLQGTLHA